MSSPAHCHTRDARPAAAVRQWKTSSETSAPPGERIPDQARPPFLRQLARSQPVGLSRDTPKGGGGGTGRILGPSDPMEDERPM